MGRIFIETPNWVSDVVNGSSMASLALLVWDFTLTFGDEVRYIWPLPRQSPLKWLFLFLRYFSLFFMIMYQFKPTTTAFYVHGASSHACKIWSVSETLGMEILIMSTEVVLIIRVWLLFKRSMRIAAFFATIVLLEFIAMIILITIVTKETDFGAYCIPFLTHKLLISFTVGMVGPHMIVFSCTVFKCFDVIRAHWNTSPIFSLLLRDGGLAFAGLLLSVVVDATLYGTMSKGFCVLSVTWIVCVMGAAGCRLIINLQHLTRRLERAERDAPNPVELTTFGNVGWTTFEDGYNSSDDDI